MADNESTPSETITIKVKTPSESAFPITVAVDNTVLELKEKIEKDGPGNVPVSEQRLIFAGKVLKDEEKLSVYKMKDGNTLHMVRGKKAGEAGTSDTSSSSSSNRDTSGTGTSANTNAGPLPNLFAGLGGAGGMPFGAGASPFGGGMAPNPDTMSAMFSNPEFLNMMQSMFQNPQMLNSIPGARNMAPQLQQMLGDPQMRQMLSNPQFLRSVMAMAPMMGMGGGGGGSPFGSMFPGMGATPSETTGTARTGSDNGNNNSGVDPIAAVLTGLANPAAAGAGAGAGAGGAGTPNSPSGGNTPGGNPLANNPLLASLLAGGLGGLGGMGGMGGFGGAPQQPADSRPPEERFATQLQQLQEMGFHDGTKNLRALTISGGNVNAAIEWLFSNP
ncbi:hypothetical protein HDU85_004387 [Gaertneriomyces sp. JEL0708]|nr:hypothetical protein HDU85_004387 [Gaertneriomyces sp. JEL0708]